MKKRWAKMMQIVNTDPTGRGVHWILLSTVDCPPGVIRIYDSAQYNHISPEVEKVIAQLVKLPLHMSTIQVQFMEGDIQPNSSDCGVYSIAHMVAIISGVQDPHLVKFQTSAMRAHLLSNIEQAQMTPFPVLRSKRKKRWSLSAYHVYEFEVSCTCRMPDTGGLYFECTVCGKEFHPKCQNIKLTPIEIKRKEFLPCLACSDKQENN